MTDPLSASILQPRIVERNGQRDRLGEGLLWSPTTRTLYWTDILAPALNRLSLGDGRVERWPMPEPLGWVVERRNEPGLIAGFASGFSELSLDPVNIRPFLDPEPGFPGNRLNDATVDAEGRIWAGTMPLAGDRPTGSLYRLDPDRSCQRVDAGYHVANGPAISPDGRWLYHADSPRGVVYRFALGEEGVSGGRHSFITFPPEWGVPDGMTCDAEGGLWIAHWGGARISRFLEDGSLDGSIALPTPQITNVAFAGVNLDRLFVTSAAADREDDPFAGCLFELRPGVRGFPPHRYAG